MCTAYFNISCLVLAWSSASKLQVKSLEVLQNQMLHMFVAAPWFVNKAQVHQDLSVPPSSEHMMALPRGTLLRASQSKNPSIQCLRELDPDRRSPRIKIWTILKMEH